MTVCGGKTIGLPGQYCDAPFSGGGEPDCIYCGTAGQHPEYPCTIVPGSGNSIGRCGGNAAAEVVWDPRYQPCFRAEFADGANDMQGQAEAWWARDVWANAKAFQYVPARAVSLILIPCSTCEPCGPTSGRWLCRWFVTGSPDGWRMYCNHVYVCQPEDGGQGCDQLRGKLCVLNLDGTPRHVHLHLAAKSDPHCFQYVNQFCFSHPVPDEAGIVAVIGSTYPDRVEAVDRIEIAADLAYSEVAANYPFRNPAEVTLLNAILGSYTCETYNLVDKIDNPGHVYASYYPHDYPGKHTWSHAEEFDGSVPDHPMAYPPVMGIAKEGPDDPDRYGDDYAGQVIPITLRGRRSKVELPAELILAGHAIQLYMLIEQWWETSATGQARYRVFADIFFTVRLRVRLMAAAFDVDWPLQLLGRPGGTDDPCDLRVEDPDHPGQQHPYERLIAIGPQGERVPMQRCHAGGGYDDAEITWCGRATTRMYSRGHAHLGGTDASGWYDSPRYYPGNPTCCGALHTINGTVIHGETDNCGGLQTDGSFLELPQWCEGRVVLGLTEIENAGCRGWN